MRPHSDTGVQFGRTYGCSRVQPHSRCHHRSCLQDGRRLTFSRLPLEPALSEGMPEPLRLIPHRLVSLGRQTCEPEVTVHNESFTGSIPYKYSEDHPPCSSTKSLSISYPTSYHVVSETHSCHRCHRCSRPRSHRCPSEARPQRFSLPILRAGLDS